jgi:pimeloyl-ACP methyl ester carboxylesterase
MGEQFMKRLVLGFGIGLWGICAFGQGTKLVPTPSGKLEMLIRGSGKPPIIFENGFSDSLDDWNSVAAGLSRVAETVQYNRAGFGHSELNQSKRTAQQIPTDLHAALQKAGVKPPYILVGHSVGALYIQEFAFLFPRATTGLVFVDPATVAFYRWLDRNDPELSEKIREAIGHGPAGPKAQFEGMSKTLRQVAAAWPLPKVPVILVAAEKGIPDFSPRTRKAFSDAQKKLAAQFDRAEVISAVGCGHGIPVECPAVLEKAIFRMLDQLHKSGGLNRVY